MGSQVREPLLSVTSTFLLNRPVIRVALPLDAPLRMHHVELDTLLATGLARFLVMEQFVNRFIRFVFVGVVLLACFITLHGILYKSSYLKFPLALLLLVCAFAAWMYWWRRIVFAADIVAIGWLGRGQVCEGLHGLARYRRTPQRHQLSEPSLEERMTRVCGSRVASSDRDLTLVR
jgi:hypothetical protein